MGAEMRRYEHRRALWGTKLGFYFAAIGSAFGLGNIWRFPYVVAENGGGAFVLLYLCFLFLLGLPLLIGELMIGKTTRRSVVSALSRLKRSVRNEQINKTKESSGRMAFFPELLGRCWLRLMPYVGRFSVFVGLVVLAYFAVISGWVLFLLVHHLQLILFQHTYPVEEAFDRLMVNGWLQMILTLIHLVIVSLIVAKDVEKGIERWVGFMMPIFAILMVVLLFNTLNMPAATDAIRFLFYPDFSKLNYASVSQAVGHVFFTLSIGFGSMVTFGSYLPDKVLLSRAGFRVTTIDSIISLGAGLLIFPIFLSSVPVSSGPELLFRTVPVLFREMSGGVWFGTGFFLCLYLAALGASIGLLETTVSNLADSQKVKRVKGTYWAGVTCLFLAIIPSLSTNVLKGVRVGSMSILEFFDSLLINWILPLVALLVSQGVLYGLSDKSRKKEFFENDVNDAAVIKSRMYAHWIFALRWVAPIVVLASLLLQLVGLLK